VRFLLDENQSPAIAPSLIELGHDVVHVRDVDLAGAKNFLTTQRRTAG
jgi:hypothetical protein